MERVIRLDLFFSVFEGMIEILEESSVFIFTLKKYSEDKNSKRYVQF